MQEPLMPFTDLRAQYEALRSEIHRRIDTVLQHGQYIMGPEVAELEQKLASFVDVRHCVSASSGTDTLLIAMMALGIGRDDEVITTPFTFAATAEMIVLLGARPIFVDIDPETYNIDPARIASAITSRTRAVMPVSIYGQCADMDTINDIASHHGLAVIEDAAQSFGSTYKGRRSCGLCTVGSTSFFPSKPLGAYGDGGALFTNDEELAGKMRQIRLHGQASRYQHVRLGINGRLDTLQAAVLLAKFDRFGWEIDERRAAASRYDSLISERCPGIKTPYVASYNTSVFAQYTIEVEARDEVSKALRSQGVPTAIHYPLPINAQPAYAAFGSSLDTPIAAAKASRVLSLPMSADVQLKHQEQVIDALRRCVS